MGEEAKNCAFIYMIKIVVVTLKSFYYCTYILYSISNIWLRAMLNVQAIPRFCTCKGAARVVADRDTRAVVSTRTAPARPCVSGSHYWWSLSASPYRGSLALSAPGLPFSTFVPPHYSLAFSLVFSISTK